ncbi:uncharacterized protein BDZ99DRAFT_545203, partial [Mytilinidion resinicola]
ITLVTIQAFILLHNLIKQEANKPGSKQRLQRHVQKLASAASISFAKQTLLQDQNRFLYKLNKEAKCRRSTKSLILGKAKVMSYEGLEEARANRAAKDIAKGKGKGQRGRPRKNPAPEAEVEASKGKRGRKRKSLALDSGADADADADAEADSLEVEAGKLKRGRKRKNPVPEVDAEAGSLELEAGLLVPKDKVARMSEVEPAKVPAAPFRAPVAWMY